MAKLNPVVSLTDIKCKWTKQNISGLSTPSKRLSGWIKYKIQLYAI